MPVENEQEARVATGPADLIALANYGLTGKLSGKYEKQNVQGE